MNIILLAPPGAGKGTQAELLKETYHFHHISTGNLLRDASQEESDFGRNLRKIMESGNLVSDDIVLEVLNRYLEQLSDVHLLLDGFPRNIYQAEKLDEILEKRNNQVDYVFLLDVDEITLRNRITGRRLCKSCGKVYNIHIDPLKPKIDSICDQCGSNLFQRQDDNLETFQIRYQEYLKQTKPLIDYYQKQNKLYSLDGNLTKEEIFHQIESILGKR